MPVLNQSIDQRPPGPAPAGTLLGNFDLLAAGDRIGPVPGGFMTVFGRTVDWLPTAVIDELTPTKIAWHEQTPPGSEIGLAATVSFEQTGQSTARVSVNPSRISWNGWPMLPMSMSSDLTILETRRNGYTVADAQGNTSKLRFLPLDREQVGAEVLQAAGVGPGDAVKGIMNLDLAFPGGEMHKQVVVYRPD